MAVSRLASLSGVQKRAIDNYLRTKKPAMPVADAAVKIARALEVTVEYLVLGEEQPVLREIRRISRNLQKVSARDRRLIADLLESMIKRKNSEVKG
jgi:transcriptional regulator with XRE-family HTH domain